MPVVPCMKDLDVHDCMKKIRKCGKRQQSQHPAVDKSLFSFFVIWSTRAVFCLPPPRCFIVSRAWTECLSGLADSTDSLPAAWQSSLLVLASSDLISIAR